MIIDSYVLLYILLFTSTITYIFFRVLQINKRKKGPIKKDISMNHRYSEIASELLGCDFIDKDYEANNPFLNKLDTPPPPLPIELIVDGIFLEKNLDSIQKDVAWLKKTLQKKGIEDINRIYYAVMDSSGRVHFDVMEKEDQ